jgi:hypothetical protein
LTVGARAERSDLIEMPQAVAEADGRSDEVMAQDISPLLTT